MVNQNVLDEVLRRDVYGLRTLPVPLTEGAKKTCWCGGGAWRLNEKGKPIQEPHDMEKHRL